MQKSRSLADLVQSMDPEVHMNMKTAVETGRWPNGDRLSEEQTEQCLQLIIAYEQQLPEHERVGYIDRSGLKKSHCDEPDAAPDEPQALRWLDRDGD